MSIFEGDDFNKALTELNESIESEGLEEVDETPEGSTSEEVETPPAVENAEVPSPAPETPSPALNPRALSDEQWQQWEIYQGIDNRLRTEPDFAARFAQAFADENPPQLEEAPELPFDPAIQAYIDQRLGQVLPTLQQHQQVLEVQQQRENDAAITRAKATYQSLHELDDVAMERVYKTGETYAQMLGPLLSSGLSKEDALLKVFDVALFQIDDLRNAEVARLSKQTTTDQKRKAKAGSLSGSSGSIPRTPPPVPTTRAEINAAMVKELSQSLGLE